MPERYFEKILPDKDCKFEKVDRNLPRVLVVDDSKPTVFSYVCYFRLKGIDITGIWVNSNAPYEANGIITNEVVQYARNKTVIIDYGLGNVDVREILQKLLEDTRIILLSGADRDLSKYPELKNRSICQLVKPIEPEKLLEIIKNPKAKN